jgi:4-hydroxy-3-polyprenylbenzoate decarboxylase
LMLSPANRKIALAMTGASGAFYGLRLLEVLLSFDDVETHLLVTPSGAEIIRLETGREVSADGFRPESLGIEGADRLRFHRYDCLSSPLASGSFPLDALVIAPCSMACVSAVASGASRNLVERAADVAIKERRTLILVPRETPLSVIHLDNLHKLAAAGAVVMPACPGFYGRPDKVSDLVDFMVARILDHLRLPHSLGPRWTGAESGCRES